MKVGLIVKNDFRSKEVAKSFCNDINIDYFDLEKSVKTPDIIACFGGDGSFLRAASYAIEYNVPIVSVNTGTLGFLSSLGVNEKEKFDNVIYDESVDFEQIPLFCAMITRGSENQTEQKQFLFVNEAVVQRVTSKDTYNGAMSLSVCINGKPCQKFVSDGVITATPIGSTAYSMSAGGAILSPELRGMIITPLCPHTVSARPIVVSDQSVVTLFTGEKTRDCVLLTDGIYRGSLDENDQITVTKSDKVLKVVAGSKNFFEKLNEKLLKWGDVYV